MDYRPRFTIGLVIRVAFLVVSVVALTASLLVNDLSATRIVAVGLVAAAVISIWQHVQRTNLEIARFIEALQFNDFAATFGAAGADGGFDELGTAMTAVVTKLRDDRSQQGDFARFYEAVVDDIPVALLTVDADQRVNRANKAARQLFADAGGVRIEDFARYGGAFRACLTEQANREQIIQLQFDEGPQRALVRSARVNRLGGAMQAVVVQPIQGALNAVEIVAQSDLIRVLTHEIMNSMTPVTSLAQSAADLMASVDDRGDPAIADAREAIQTLARRADGVMHFVDTYRQISRPPQLRRTRFTARAFADQLAQLFVADWPASRAALSVTITPDDLVIDADRDLLTQVLINLMRNGAEAAAESQTVIAIDLSIVARRGALVQIDVTDNGPGIPEALQHDIFLPFFTTKPKGTGVGLSLARQIVLAHGGSIEAGDAPAGGARFRIIV